MAKLVSKVYGDALFETAVEKGQVEECFEEVSALLPILKDHPDLIQLLRNPKVVKEEKISVMNRIFDGRVMPDLMGFLTIIVEKDRQNDLIPIFEYFITRVKEHKRIGNVVVTSAAPLSEGQKQLLEQRLLETTVYRTLETDYQVDASLVGGLVIRIGDRVADNSIKTQLYELKRDLSRLQLV